MKPEIYTPKTDEVLVKGRYPFKSHCPAWPKCTSLTLDSSGLRIRLDDHEQEDMWLEILLPPDMLRGLAMVAENNRRLAAQYPVSEREY